MIETIIDGHLIVLDTEDAPALDAATWHVRPVGRAGLLRVVAYTRIDRRFKCRQLHRELVGAKKGEWVYFLDGNPFDLRRSNLLLSSEAPSTLTCPFSPDELRSMYEGEPVSREVIGQRAAELLGRRPLSYECVDRWLTDAGIPMRDHSAALAVRHSRGNEPFPDWQERAAAARRKP
jgi:hypothetical protein